MPACGCHVDRVSPEKLYRTTGILLGPARAVVGLGHYHCGASWVEDHRNLKLLSRAATAWPGRDPVVDNRFRHRAVAIARGEA